jgi:hypothetical protein
MHKTISLNPEGKKLLWLSERRRKNNIKMYLKVVVKFLIRFNYLR